MIDPNDLTGKKDRNLLLTHCPNNGSLLVFPESSAGRRVSCPGCQQQFTAPKITFGEVEWRSSQSAELAIAYLKAIQAEPSERKRRLLACGVCHLCWKQLDGRCRQALQVAERYADGFAEDAEREATY